MKRGLWLARLLILTVIASNLQAAFVFLVSPGTYVPGFELNGPPGEAAVRGMAVLFLMWNIPYMVAAWQPARHMLSLKEAIAMQTIGVAGETAILLSLSPETPLLYNSIERFIFFDAAGLVLLIIAFLSIRRLKTISQVSEGSEP